eukprot:TRINITY_DN45652_c0_g1_i1.p1 TRINITY_DN45652_c0_g1~~TRINITY_DN45652_c0_g1_i1.p1  ORF type:complete len:604 (+),score=62.75 TRINITY_DN45652_c0_g1_i1:207-2018(+)
MHRCLHLLGHVILWTLADAGYDASWDEEWTRQGLKCGSDDASAELSHWCNSFCTGLMRILRLRNDATFSAGSLYELERVADTMDVWRVCGLGWHSVWLCRATERLRLLRPSLQTEPGQGTTKEAFGIITTGEVVLRNYFRNVNLTVMFGKIVGAAMFFHADRFLSEIMLRFPFLIDYDVESVKEPCSSELVALREYLLQDAPTLGPLGMSTCKGRTGCDQELKLQRWRGSPLRISRNLQTIEVAALLLAEADFMRQGKLDKLKGHDKMECQRLLNLGQSFLLQAYRHELPRSRAGPDNIYIYTSGLLSLTARSSVPIFSVLDRLESLMAPPLALDTASESWKHRLFFMHLLPTNSIESTQVRGFMDLHCDMPFKNMLLAKGQLLRGSAQIRVVEVGAHLGGCILHAITHLGDQARGLAIEPYAPAAAALRRTVVTNGIEKQLMVDDRFICADSRQQFIPRTIQSGILYQTEWEQVSSSTAFDADRTRTKACASLTTVLKESRFDAVDVLRVHVLGRELEVLQSAQPMLAAGRVRSIAVAVLCDHGQSMFGQDIGRIAQLLHSHGYVLQYEGWVGYEVFEMISCNRSSVSGGTTTLFAHLDPSH